MAVSNSGNPPWCELRRIITVAINSLPAYPSEGARVAQCREIRMAVVLTATRKIKAGEQLLWDYGTKYEGEALLEKCICNACSPELLESSSTNLPPVETRVFPTPLGDHPDMTVHAENWEPAPLTTRSLLVSMTLKAGMAAMVVSHQGFDEAELAYRNSRWVVLGTEGQFVEAGTVPEGANQLCRLLNMAFKDAFEEGNPVVLLLKSRRREPNPLVILLGQAILDDSRKRYGNCLVFVEDMGLSYPVEEQTEHTRTLDSVHKEFAKFDVVHNVTTLDDAWSQLRLNPHCRISDVKALLDLS
ncbi:hypothetical protein Y032_0094g2700 [Ancylostoma ceylanicum]|uniref:SET domain-containing protein n=1 Tax=Ancylostoma ceylanicum TaxID=53326 RepID=A0A016TL78_9BILA|nr:hypothetical protein Y032_0094g2700 [Ancylostoma ceylanicum]